MGKIGVSAIMAGLLVAAACSREEAPEIDDQPLEPSVEDEAPAFVGVWASDPDLCEIAPGSEDPAPIAFTIAEFVGYENRCRIARMQEGTEGGYRLELVCLAEGIETRESVDIDVDGEMLRMRWNEGDETVFVRCPEVNE